MCVSHRSRYARTSTRVSKCEVQVLRTWAPHPRERGLKSSCLEGEGAQAPESDAG